MSDDVKYKIDNKGGRCRVDLSDHLPINTDVILVYKTKSTQGSGYEVIDTCLPHQLYVDKLLDHGELKDLGFIAINTKEDRISIHDLENKRDLLLDKLHETEEQTALIKKELQKY